MSDRSAPHRGRMLRSNAKFLLRRNRPVTCPHVADIRDVVAGADGCEDCLAVGDTWVHLRLCLSCGHVGCCDNSKNKHATKHFHATDHPVIRSHEPGEDWLWCYVDEAAVTV